MSQPNEPTPTSGPLPTKVRNYIAALWYAVFDGGDFYAVLMAGLEPGSWDLLYRFRYDDGRPDSMKASVYSPDNGGAKTEFFVLNETDNLIKAQPGIRALRRVLVRGPWSKLKKRIESRDWARFAKLLEVRNEPTEPENK